MKTLIIWYAVIIACGVRQTESNELVGAALTDLLIDKIRNLWSQGHINILGRHCEYEINPRIHRWELKYHAVLWCPGWVPFKGRAKKYSKKGAVEHATRDFVHKAISANVIDKNDAQVWLNNN